MVVGFHIYSVTLIFSTQCNSDLWASSIYFRQFSKMGFVDSERIAIWGWVSSYRIDESMCFSVQSRTCQFLISVEILGEKPVYQLL